MQTWTSVRRTTADAVLTPTASIQTAASAAAAEPVTMETDSLASVNLSLEMQDKILNGKK